MGKSDARGPSTEAKDLNDEQEPNDSELVDEPRSSSKVSYKATVPVPEAVAYFEAITDGLRRGSLTLRQGAGTLTLELGSEVQLEIKAASKKRKGKITFTIEWGAPHQPDN